MALRSISLALQGGGVHGAFTWGALDRLLEEERLDIAAISATSAGALNAAALKAGMLRDGRAGARANLDWLWEQIGAIPNDALSAWFAAAGPDAGSISRAIEASPAYQWGEAVSRMVSPYQLPLPNPLRRIAERFDFDRVCAASPPSLHVCATNVRTGKVRVFAGAEITADAILASACLPTLFRAIEITDPATGIRDAYWDGGYTGNPGAVSVVPARPARRSGDREHQPDRTPRHAHNGCRNPEPDQRDRVQFFTVEGTARDRLRAAAAARRASGSGGDEGVACPHDRRRCADAAIVGGHQDGAQPGRHRPAESCRAGRGRGVSRSLLV
jgi:predicted acylesterase/phospholipase RssA